MRRILMLLLLLVLLSGCDGSNETFDRAMSLRTGLLQAEGCHFEAEITADYGDKTYTFQLACQADKEGNLSFTVLQPAYIAGITGKICGDGGELIFDDIALAFELQADGLLSPVSAPWVVLRALRSGYVENCVQEDGYHRMRVNDSYQEDALMLDIWFDAEQVPRQADIYEDNRRILTVIIGKYALM